MRHGTRSAYHYDRCRCSECRAANTAACRAYERRAEVLRPDLVTRRRCEADEIAVERAAAGDPVVTTPADRRAAAALLRARSMPPREIARRLGVRTRTVYRYLSDLSEPTGATS